MRTTATPPAPPGDVHADPLVGRCPGCFAPVASLPCARCGFDPAQPPPDNAPTPGLLLDGRFVIGAVTGASDDLGLTCRAWDQLSGGPVRLDEYLPAALVLRPPGALEPGPRADAPTGLFEAGLARFLAEGRRLAQLGHPNLLAVRECLAAHGGGWWVIDEQPGETLAALLARQPQGRLPAAQASALLGQVLAGLSAWHDSGMLHRGLSPETVWLARGEDGQPQAVLTGFTGAREALVAHGLRGMRRLAPGYAALEQYRDEAQGPRTDVYAAAAIGYRMLTGCAPPPASVRAVRDELIPAVRLGVPAPVSAALTRALALQPDGRPPSVAALREALAPRGQVPVGGWSRRLLAARGVRRALGLGLAGLLAAAVVGGWLFVEWARGGRDAAAWAAAVALDTEDGYRGYLGACAADGCGHREAAERRLRVLAARARLAAERAARAAAAAARAEAAARRAELQAAAAAALAGPRPAPPAAPVVATPLLPTIVPIPAGSFLMGSPGGEPGHSDHEAPRRRVRIAAFGLAATELTFAEWDACVAANACRAQPDDQGYGRGSRPAINLSWDDAQDYIRWLNRETGGGYRLPSEAEWEYAARAGAGTAFAGGACLRAGEANFNASEAYGNCPVTASRPAGQTRPVGSFPANAWGLHDLHGNAQEWVADCWHRDHLDAPADGRPRLDGNCGLRVLRGGGWTSGAAGVRAAARDRYSAAARSLGFGFRLAQTLAP